jgi:hypothetical protein
MLDAHRLWLFFVAAFILAITPGPGIMYVLARTLAGGRREGLHSAVGTFFGGIVHVSAAAAGVSAVLADSFTMCQTAFSHNAFCNPRLSESWDVPHPLSIVGIDGSCLHYENVSTETL